MGGRGLSPGRLHRAALPAIAEAADGGFFVLAKADGEKVLVQRPGAPSETLARAALAARWTGRALLPARRAQLPGEGRLFGLVWFVPTPVRRRHAPGAAEALSVDSAFGPRSAVRFSHGRVAKFMCWISSGAC